MIESQDVVEQVSEQRFGRQPRPALATERREPTPAHAEPVGQSAPDTGDAQRVQATLVLLVLGSLLVLLSVRIHSDPALVAGVASLLASTLLHRHTRARIAARIERRALACGTPPEQARQQSLAHAEELLASLGRGEPDTALRAAASGPLGDGSRRREVEPSPSSPRGAERD